MEKRYQVFVSSTYNDLKDERALVFQTLMEMDCFPAGMELFPAADEEQWEFIKKIIDDCDYYLLIIAGRYGSTITPAGLSYTEKEYDYAIEKGMKVLAFVHEDPGKLAVEKSDINEDLRTRLSAFRDRVKSRCIVKFWKSGADLPGLVALSLTKTIKSHPAVGWVRANQVGSAELLGEVNELRKHNQELQKVIAQFNPGTDNGIPENLAGAAEKVTLGGTHFERGRGTISHWQCTLAWSELFGLIAPYLLEPQNDALSKARLEAELFARTGRDGTSVTMKSHDFQTIKVQFLAFGWIKLDQFATTKGGMALFWSLTSKGREIMMQTRAVRSAPAS
jgi:hypothetical protein